MELINWKRETPSKKRTMLKRKSKVLSGIILYIHTGDIKLATLSKEKREINNLLNQ